MYISSITATFDPVCICDAVILYDKVSRIFAANLLAYAATVSGNGWTARDSTDDFYLVTSDTDLWPISDSAYTLPDGVDVLSLNAFCCGTFQHRSQTYRMVPLANIGARLATWRNLTHRRVCNNSLSFFLIVYLRMN